MAMLVHYRKDGGRSARSIAERNLKSVTEASRAHVGSSGARRRKIIWPAIDQDRLTLISLSVIVVLVALNLMVRFPDLGVLISQLNQF
jgi:hypothetical protein